MPRWSATFCRRLDGIPLAIEFVAARVGALGMHGVASHLDERLRLVTSGRRTAVPRHRTLSATLDWSYRLLTEAEQRVFRRLAIFAGGFTLHAAGVVAADAGQPEAEIIDQVAELVTKSLVAADVSDTEPRLRLLEVTRLCPQQARRERRSRCTRAPPLGLLSRLAGSNAEHFVR